MPLHLGIARLLREGPVVNVMWVREKGAVHWIDWHFDNICKVGHLCSDVQGCVDFDLGCSTTFCSTAKSVLPISHPPKQNLAEGGNFQVKVNQIQQSEQMDHPAIVRLL